MDTQKTYRVFTNWDFSGMGTILTPESPRKELPLNRAHIERFVNDAANSDVDAFLCCPTVLRCPLWNSKARPYWDEPASDIEEPENDDECTSSQRTMKRIRKYVKNGGNPIMETYEAVKRNKMGFFFSLRMNDWHNMNELTADNADRFPTLDAFYKQHPEYRIGKDNPANTVGWWKMNPLMQDYIYPEVRQHYLALIDELIALCPIDGFELDFMRCMNYFKPEDIAEGTALMTDFIREVRKKLDVEGEKQHRFLPLCLRMPQFYDICAALGFDLETLSKENTVQYITVSSSYIQSLNLEIDKFKRHLPDTKIFGEIQAMLPNSAKIRPGYSYCVERRMTDEMYRGAADALFKMGADGITLFNFQFLRPLTLGGWKQALEPDLSNAVLKSLADESYLATCDKHYLVSGKDVALPKTDEAALHFKLYDSDFSSYKRAVLRVVCARSDIADIETTVVFNGKALPETENGELFRPAVNEGLPEASQAKNFAVDTALLKTDNMIEITLPNAEITLVELALYTH